MKQSSVLFPFLSKNSVERTFALYNIERVEYECQILIYLKSQID